MNRSNMNYELTDVTILDRTRRNSAEMEDIALRIVNAKNKIRREIFYKECITGATALVLYLIFLIPFANDYLNHGSTLFKVMVFLVAPVLFTVLAAKISSIPLKKHFYESMNRESAGGAEALSDTFRVLLFKQDMSRGRVWLTAVGEDTVCYNVEINGEVESRFIKLKSVKLVWGAETTKITFYPDSIEFELMGGEEE